MSSNTHASELVGFWTPPNRLPIFHGCWNHSPPRVHQKTNCGKPWILKRCESCFAGLLYCQLQPRVNCSMSKSSTAKKMTLAGPALETVPGAEDSRDFRQQMGHISRQSSVFFAGTIFTAAAGYLFKIYLARVLGAEALGIYALGMTIIGFLGIFNALGLPQSAVRFVAAYCATGKIELLRGFLGRGILLLLISNILLGGGVLLVGPWIALHFYHTQALQNYLGWFALIMILGALTTFFGQVLAGYKDVARRTVVTNFIGSPTMMILTL